MTCDIITRKKKKKNNPKYANENVPIVLVDKPLFADANDSNKRSVFYEAPLKYFEDLLQGNAV